MAFAEKDQRSVLKNISFNKTISFLFIFRATEIKKDKYSDYLSSNDQSTNSHHNQAINYYDPTQQAFLK